jgi:hypothetical protein
MVLWRRGKGYGQEGARKPSCSIEERKAVKSPDEIGVESTDSYHGE